MNAFRLFFIALLFLTFSACRTSKVRQAENRLIKEEKLEKLEEEKLLKESKKQHLQNQSKEALKMMRDSKKYSRKLNRPKRK